MSILLHNALIRPELYTLTWKDILYNDLKNVIYNEGYTNLWLNRLWYFEENGKDSKCIIDEILYFDMLVDYLILMQDEIYHLKCLTQEAIDKIVDSYNLECVRKTVLCRFNNTALYDKLMSKVNIKADGWENMVIELYDENNCLKPWIVI